MTPLTPFSDQMPARLATGCVGVFRCRWGGVICETLVNGHSILLSPDSFIWIKGIQVSPLFPANLTNMPGNHTLGAKNPRSSS